MNLVFKEFLQTSIPPLISVLYAKGYHYVPLKFFLSHSYESFRRGTLLYFRKFRISKNFMPKRGVSRFSVKFFLFRSTEKLRRGTLLCCVSENFRKRKSFWMRGGGIKIFRRNFFVSQCRKISWASLQCFRKFGVSKNFMHTRGYHNFPSKIFCLSAKNFVKEPFSVPLISGIEKC